VGVARGHEWSRVVTVGHGESRRVPVGHGGAVFYDVSHLGWGGAIRIKRGYLDQTL
jgi:hypothetical protein